MNWKPTPIIKVTHDQINELINSHFGSKEGFEEPYSLSQVEGLDNHSNLNIVLDDNDQFENLRILPVKGEFQWVCTKPILTYLACKGIIPKGEYLITLDWD